MDPQSNQDQGLSVPQPPPGGPATMPLPGQPPFPAAQAGLLPQPAQNYPMAPSAAAAPAQQSLPVPPQAPPLAAATGVLQPTVPVHPVAAPAAPAGNATDQFASAQNTPGEASDTDVIEKEWVEKAKEVVWSTQQDPYRQVLAINQLKSDYMKKRYNKDIKIPDA